jgi:hypothetical protein
VFVVEDAPNPLVTLFLGVWMAVALVKLVRVLASVHALFALRDRCRPVPEAIVQRLPLWLRASRQGRKTELAMCDGVSGATLLGLSSPCIALPPSLVASLRPEQLDLVVLHEYAHVQRRDDWMALAQALALPALWIHPVTSFVVRQLGFEREVACDEWVIARTARARDYAACLARAAEIRAVELGRAWLAPALFGGPSDLVRRVDRLLAGKAHFGQAFSRPIALAAACFLVLVLTQLRAVPLVGGFMETALPQIIRPAAIRVVAPLQAPEPSNGAVGPMSSRVRPEPDATYAKGIVRREPDTTDAARLEPGPSYAAGFDQPTEHREPSEPPGPSVAIQPPARSITGLYAMPVAPPPQAVTAAPWRRMTNVGAQIGQTAEQAGLGVANAFARTGVSLAKKF